MSNISVGKKGEELARDYLSKLGYKILECTKGFQDFAKSILLHWIKIR